MKVGKVSFQNKKTPWSGLAPMFTQTSGKKGVPAANFKKGSGIGLRNAGLGYI